jgi:hypothetical protein
LIVMGAFSRMRTKNSTKQTQAHIDLVGWVLRDRFVVKDTNCTHQLASEIELN